MKALWMVGFAMVAFSGGSAHANDSCTALTDGGITDSSGAPVRVGWDTWGYNYFEQSFSGSFMNFRRGDKKYEAYRGVELEMRWNDAWLSTTDCNGDGRLDRHAGFETYIGSGAQLTTRKWREYDDESGRTCSWSQLTVFQAAPTGANKRQGYWYLDGKTLGPVVWGQFYVAEEVFEDSCDNPPGDIPSL